MIIVLNAKKTILVTSIGLCFLGTLFAAFKIYYKTLNQRKVIKQKSTKSKQQRKHANNQIESSGSGSGANKKLERPNSLNQPTKALNIKSKKGGTVINKKEHNLLMMVSSQDGVKNIPAEELLELGLNYLNQAIKSWETALDSIESAAYMQSQTLALPNDEHAELVFRLRNLLDNANSINLNCKGKLVQTSQTLQIIQSRLALKQQLYAGALLKNNNYSTNHINEAGNEENVREMNGMIKSESSFSYKSVSSPMEALQKRFGYTSDDDNESFVSADSDVDWLNEEMLQNIQNLDEKNVLYEMALSAVNLDKVTYRVSRSELLKCVSESDFAAKLHVLRMGFDKLMEDVDKKAWLIEEGKNLLSNLMKKAGKDSTGFHKTYDELVRYVSVENNWKNIKDELATRDVNNLNFYDIALDFILLDAFEDLENPPSAILAVIQNRWLSQSFKETALATAVWSVLKAKRKLLKYPDGFITRFYSITEYLVPVLAWGFLGTDPELNKSCSFLKNQVVEYLRCLFDVNRTRFTNLEELTYDIEAHTRKYLREMTENI